MTQHCCHCCTPTNEQPQHIYLDEQLLQERDKWRNKAEALEHKLQDSLGTLRQSMYNECSELMQTELVKREEVYVKTINQKNAQLQALQSKNIQLEAKLKLLQKQIEVERQSQGEKNSDSRVLEQMVAQLRAAALANDQRWEERMQQAVATAKINATEPFKDQISKLEKTLQSVGTQLKEYEKKYQLIIPEVEKMKQALVQKTVACEEVNNEKTRMEKIIETLKKDNATMNTQIGYMKHGGSKAQAQLDLVQQELEAVKRQKQEVRVEPVYIEKPVEVEKIVEKIVSVEKVVRQVIIQPNPQAQLVPGLTAENTKLKEQVGVLTKQLAETEINYENSIAEYQQSIHVHEDNTLKYKQQREALVVNITQLHKEIEVLQSLVGKSSCCANPNQKLTLHIAKDGTFKKIAPQESSTQVRITTAPNNKARPPASTKK